MNAFKQAKLERIKKAKRLIVEDFLLEGYTYEKAKEYFDEAFKQLLAERNSAKEWSK
jgi:hypothetical protein